MKTRTGTAFLRWILYPFCGLALIGCLRTIPAPTAIASLPPTPPALIIQDFQDDCVPFMSDETPCGGNDILSFEVIPPISGVETPAYTFKISLSPISGIPQQPERDACLGFDLDLDDATGYTSGEMYGIDLFYCYIFTTQTVTRYEYLEPGEPPVTTSNPPGITFIADSTIVEARLHPEKLLGEPFEVQAQTCLFFDVYSCDQTGPVVVKSAGN